MSYATFSAKNVEKACCKWLEALDKDITATKEKMIAKAMVKPRWFSKQWSREEAIEYLSNTEYGISEMEYAEHHLWKDKEDIMALLALAKKAPSDVNVCSNDAYILQRFL